MSRVGRLGPGDSQHMKYPLSLPCCCPRGNQINIISLNGIHCFVSKYYFVTKLPKVFYCWVFYVIELI